MKKLLYITITNHAENKVLDGTSTICMYQIENNQMKDFGSINIPKDKKGKDLMIENLKSRDLDYNDYEIVLL